MFPGKNLSSLLNLPRIINSLNNTLNVAKQIIPIYKEAKPMVGNIRKAFTTVKNYANNTSKIIEHAHENVKPLKEKINTIKSANSKTNNPTFFQ